MEIRLMTIEDYDEVYRLWKNTDGVGLRSLDDSQEGISKFLQRNPSTNFIAQENNELIGVILCGHDGRRGYIYHGTVKEKIIGTAGLSVNAKRCWLLLANTQYYEHSSLNYY